MKLAHMPSIEHDLGHETFATCPHLFLEVFSSLGFSSSLNLHSLTLYGLDKRGNKSPPVRHKEYFGLRDTGLIVGCLVNEDLNTRNATKIGLVKVHL